MASANVKVVPFRTLSTVRVANALKRMRASFSNWRAELSRSIAQTRRVFRSCTDREIVINCSGGAQGRPLIPSRGSFTPISRYQTTITKGLTLSFVRHKRRFVNRVNGEWGQFTLRWIFDVSSSPFLREIVSIAPLFLYIYISRVRAFFNRNNIVLVILHFLKVYIILGFRL